MQRSRTALALLVLLCAASGAQAQAPIHRDVVHGTVTSDSGVVAGADVIVTMAPDRRSEAAKTDAAGHYSIIFEHGTGDYLVHVSATGFETFRKRVTRTGADSALTVDVKLTKGGVQQLARVQVKASAEKPQRSDAYFHENEVGASERESQGVNGAVPADQTGDLTAAAGLVPGVAMTPGGFSVGGLSSSQNSTTLNGMAFGGADVPRDARTSVRVASSTYDPSRGWFSGGNEDVTLAPGQIFSTRRAHLTLNAPFLQAYDPIAARTGARFTSFRASLGGDGAVLGDRFTYNYGVDASRRTNDVTWLQRASPDVLARAGVAADSVARLTGILGAAGLPLTTAAVPSSQAAQSMSFIGRFDHAPYDWGSFRSAPTTYGVLAYAKLGSSDPVGLAPTATAARGGRSTQQLGMLQGLYSTYFHGGWLTNLSSAITAAHDRATPYFSAPGGSVLVASTLDDAPGGVTSLQFGGNGALLSDRRHWTWETQSVTQFYAHGRATHRVALSGDVRLDGVRNSAAGDPFGTFTFQSLAGLETGTPASFTRTLAAPDEVGREWNAYVALGDLWRVSSGFQLLYGARLEGNRFLGVPANNPAITSAFGVRTDQAPNTIHVSPRIGFTWVRSGSTNSGIRVSRIGQFSFNSTTYLRGGIGEFRNLLSPSLLAATASQTGLANGARTLTCIGSAAPTPDWSAYATSIAAIPSACVSAAATPVFADAAPSVELFDRTYSAPRSWRANLAYSSSRHGWTYGVEGLVALNLDQPGRVDLNFDPSPRFTLSDEGRPIFVTTSSIVPSNGVAASSAARRDGAFGHIIDNVSSLRSTSKQLTFTLSPDLWGVSNWFVSGAYTLGSNRAVASGFDDATFGSPLAREWSRGDLDVRHQFLLQGGFVKKSIALTLFGRFQSGLPYTPMIAGDVNGDGFANDRAFVFDPAATSDPAMAGAMRSLIAGAPSGARDCLTRQLGRAAGRNSCEGPWTASLNAQISYSGLSRRFGRNTSIALALSNPLGGLDELVHGSGNLRGWGTPSTPDRVLYTPRSFDPVAQRFTYDVNPRFGGTRGLANAPRVPFRVTLDISIDLSRNIGLQQMDRWLRPGRAGKPGKRLGVPDLVKRYSRNVPDPYKGIMEESDSLLLTREQSDSLTAIDARYRAHMDSLWTSLATYLAALPDRFDTKDAFNRQEAAVDDAWEFSRLDVKRTLPSVLSPVQLRILPWPAKMLFDSKDKVRIRVFMSG